MKFLASSFLLILCAHYCLAQTSSPKEEYRQVVTKRSEKIVATLGLKDSAKYKRVVDIVASQYVNLNTIHTAKEEKLKSLKQDVADKSKGEAAAKLIDEETNRRLDSLHVRYLAQLNKELDPQGVVAIKDGMTYGVLPITYSGYQDMLPDLTKEQKAQILSYLTEAREKAMDAGSSEEKHKWFGKYKGKINNYLSAHGYNMKKAGEDWQARIKARETKSK